MKKISILMLVLMLSAMLFVTGGRDMGAQRGYLRFGCSLTIIISLRT